MNKKTVLFVVSLLFLIVSLTACGLLDKNQHPDPEDEVGAGDDKPKYSEVPDGYKKPKDVDLKDITDFKTLKDGEQVVKKGDKEMYIYPKKASKNKTKQPKNEEYVTGVGEEEECYFHMTSSTSIIEVSPFESTKKWEFNGSGEEYQLLTSNCELVRYGSQHICHEESLVEGVVDSYSSCIRNPPDDENVTYGCGEEESWCVRNVREIIYLNNTAYNMTFIDYWDPDVNTTNMTLFYPFNETSGTAAANYGSGGATNDGTLNGDAAFVTFEDSPMVEMDGSGDYVQADSSAGLNTFLGDDSTICAIISPQTISPGSNMRIGWGNPNRFELDLTTGGDLKGSFMGCGGKTSTSQLTANTRQHVCAVFDNSADSITLYLDGSSFAGSGGCNDDNNNAMSNFKVGQRDGGNYFTGNISHVRWWNGLALSASQIEDVFDADFPTNAAPTTPTNLTVDGSTDFVGNFSGTVNMQGNGSTDVDGDNLTYFIEKGNASTADDVLDTETFESDTGDWDVGPNPGADQPWTRDEGGTPSGGTGPCNGGSGSGCGQGGSDFYIFTEVSGASGFPDKTFIVNYENKPLDNAIINISFYYHMLAADDAARMGTLYVEIFNETSNDYDTLFSVGGVNLGDTWNFKTLLATGYAGNSTIRFRTVSSSDGEGWQGDISLDTITINITDATQIAYTDVGNHTQDNSFAWDLSGEEVGEVYERFRTRSSDDVLFSNYFTIVSQFQIASGAPPSDSCTPPAINVDWEIDIDDFCNTTSTHDMGTGEISCIDTGAGAGRWYVDATIGVDETKFKCLNESFSYVKFTDSDGYINFT